MAVQRRLQGLARDLHDSRFGNDAFFATMTTPQADLANQPLATAATKPGGSISGQNPYAFSTMYVPGDTLYGSQWHLNDPNLGINVEAAWNDYSGAGIHVGVFDEAIQSEHYDLNGNYDASRHVVLFDTVNNGGAVDIFDVHGTAVAGLIAAENNGLGAVGVAFGASITGVNIFAPGWGSFIPELLNQQAGFDITSNSWGFTSFYAENRTTPDGGYWDLLFAGVEDAVFNGRGGLGTIQVHAAANGRSSSDDTNLHGLKNSRFVVTVAAMADDGLVSFYSTPGTSILVTAPSNGGILGITTTDRLGAGGYDGASDYTNSFGGTSAATPIISGVVALMLEANPDLGWRDVQDILAASARHIGGAIGGGFVGFEDYGWVINSASEWNGGGYHYSGDYGFGLVDALGAVRLAETWNQTGTIFTEWSHGPTSASGSFFVDDANSASIDVALSSPSIEIEVVEVTLTWSTAHTWSDDLDITLISPEGTVYYLIKDAGGDADTPTSWTFLTRAYLGENAAGTWTVFVDDDAAGDSGTLSNVSLTAYGSYTSASNHIDNGLYVFTNEYSDMVALQGFRTTITDPGNIGTDTLNFSAVSSNTIIDMLPGGLATIDGVAAAIDLSSIFEIAYGGDGSDTIWGNNVANSLFGGRGDDTLNGRAGADLLDGGAGADTLDGGDNADTLNGGAGADTLNGGGGADAMDGGGGNDTYVVDHAGDVTTEIAILGGTDTVFSSVSRTLGANLENLALFGALAINGKGNELANALTGNGAANVLNGLGGADTMVGNGGNDTYVVDHSGDVTTESSAAGGTDTVLSSVTRTLGANLENLTLNGALAINGTGNGLANTITGNNAANTLNGGSGDDTLNGGAGIDALTGGAGADAFVFNAALIAANRDTISGFSVPNDTIVLENAIFTGLAVGALAVSKFFIGANAHDATDRIIYDSANGRLYFDADGNGAGAKIQFATLSTGLLLTAADFFVI